MALSKKCVKIKQDKTMESTDEEEFQEKKNDKRTEKETFEMFKIVPVIHGCRPRVRRVVDDDPSDLIRLGTWP